MSTCEGGEMPQNKHESTIRSITASSLQSRNREMPVFPNENAPSQGWPLWGKSGCF